MASENNKRLQQALAPAVKQRGFKKSGATWRKASDEAISVLNLQGSQWGPSFYINLGVYFRALGDRDQPAEYHCHLRTRLTELVPDRARLNALLDFENPVEEDIRFRELEALVIEHGLPLLHIVSTIDGARDYCRSQAPMSFWVTKEARAFLGDDTWRLTTACSGRRYAPPLMLSVRPRDTGSDFPRSGNFNRGLCFGTRSMERLRPKR